MPNIILGWIFVLVNLFNIHFRKGKDRQRNKLCMEKVPPIATWLGVSTVCQKKWLQLQNLSQVSVRFHDCKGSAATQKPFRGFSNNWWYVNCGKHTEIFAIWREGDFIHATFKLIHIETFRDGKRMMATIVLRVSNLSLSLSLSLFSPFLSLHEKSNPVLEISQVTNLNWRELFPFLLTIWQSREHLKKINFIHVFFSIRTP